MTMITNHYDFSKIEYDIDLIFKKSNFKQTYENAIKKALEIFYIYLEVHLDYIHQRGKFNKLFRNKKIISNNIKNFICFIYMHCQTYSNAQKYTTFFWFKKIVKFIHPELETTQIRLSVNKESNQLKEEIEKYKKIQVNGEKLEFYKPWVITSLSDKKFNINLSNIYIKFGEKFCTQYYLIIKKIAKRKINTSLSRIITNLYTLNRLFCENFKNFQSLNEELNSKNTHQTFYKFYNLLILENIKNNYSLIYFHNRWKDYISTYMLLIEYNLFPMPYNEILIPKFKTRTDGAHHKIKTGKIINDKLIFNIPLNYTDTTAKELILQKINNDIKYIVSLSNKAMAKTNEIYDRYIKLKENGNLLKSMQDISSLNDIYYTYSHIYQKNCECKFTIKSFLRGNSEVIRLIPKLKQEDIYSFLILLIKEHPQITESWLTEWKLYDNEKLFGYTEENGKHYIASYKKRKRKKSFQKILLNEQSRNIVEKLIKITTINRDYLLNRNNSDYEYMLLINPSQFSSPKRINKLYNPSTTSTFKFFIDLFHDNFDKNSENKDYIIELCKNFSLTKFRATCAVQIYIETNSIQAMAQALGHENIDHRLIGAYLPAPLWDYFTERWIRIYQNTFIYEAMKDSPYLFNALDLTSNTLDEFIRNHHFGDLPQYLKEGKYKEFNNAPLQNKLGIFAISIPLLQWFLAIIDWNNSRQKYSEKFSKWYECAVLVISQIELSISSEQVHGFALYLDSTIFQMYEAAKKNPLSFEIVKRALEC